MEKHEIQALLEQPIAFHRIFARVAGSVTAGLMLSQLYYWTGRQKDADGWIYKTIDEWEDETTLTRYEQETARRRLRQINVIEERKKGVPPIVQYRLNLDVLFQQINILVSRKLICGNTPNQFGEIQQIKKGESSTIFQRLHSEITSETTTEIPSLSPQGESVMTDGFLSFWERYPKKVAKGAAWRAWKAGKCEPLATTIVENLATHEAMKRERQFIPNPSTWLNQKRWEDEVPVRAVSEVVDLQEIYRKAKEQYENESS